MSVTVSTDVFCDGDDCVAWISGVTGPRSDSRGARAEARSYGWRRRNGKDLCPECIAADSGQPPPLPDRRIGPDTATHVGQLPPQGAA